MATGSGLDQELGQLLPPVIKVSGCGKIESITRPPLLGCSVGILPSKIKKRTSLLMKEEILKKCQESPGLRQAKRIISDSPPEQWL